MAFVDDQAKISIFDSIYALMMNIHCFTINKECVTQLLPYIDEIKTIKIRKFPMKSRIETKETNLHDALVVDRICLFV